MRFALVFLFGCQTTVYSLNQSPRPMSPRAPEQLEVLGAGPPTRAHVDIEHIHMNGGTSMDAMLADMRRMAASRGCDGIVVQFDNGLSATCFVYTDAPVTARR